MAKTGKPIIAGVLMLVINAPWFLMSIVGFVAALVQSEEDLAVSIARTIFAVNVILSGLFVACGICTLLRRVWWLVIIGSVILLLSSAYDLIGDPLYFISYYRFLGSMLFQDRSFAFIWVLRILPIIIALVSVVLLALSKKEFGQYNKRIPLATGKAD